MAQDSAMMVDEEETKWLETSVTADDDSFHDDDDDDDERREEPSEPTDGAILTQARPRYYAKKTDIDVFSGLSKSYQHPDTGLVHAVVHRRGFGSARMIRHLLQPQAIVFSLQNDVDATTPLMFAKRGNALSRVQYAIFEAHTERRIGSLVQVQSDLVAHAYCLQGGSESATTKAAWFIYRVPAITSMVNGKPRQAEVVILNENDQQYFAESTASSKPKGKDLGETIPLLLQKKTHQPLSNDVVLKSREPYVKKNGRYGLNFHGRGRLASPKNIQLYNAAHKERGNATLTAFQMVKWDKKAYNADFASPMTPFQAFGMALAQMDL